MLVGNMNVATRFCIEYAQSMKSYTLRHAVGCAGVSLNPVLLARNRAEPALVAHIRRPSIWESEAGWF